MSKDNIIVSGGKYNYIGDSAKVLSSLPPAMYNVEFNDNIGCFLTEAKNIPQIGEKVYGSREEKVDKVILKFKNTNRNLGVLLNGAKGIGKSLFTKQVIHKAIDLGLPVIICPSFLPGVDSFLKGINQKVVIILDEYEKTFDSEEQELMLSVFDGVTDSNKLFVVTSNNKARLDSHLIDRPGRFHYFFEFEFPYPGEIFEYISDCLPDASTQFKNDVAFLSFVSPLTYDSLRAIVEEKKMLGSDATLMEVIQDINVAKTQGSSPDSLTVEITCDTPFGRIPMISTGSFYGSNFNGYLRFRLIDVPSFAKYMVGLPSDFATLETSTRINIPVHKGCFEGQEFVCTDLGGHAIPSFEIDSDMTSEACASLCSAFQSAASVIQDYSSPSKDDEVEVQAIKDIKAFCAEIKPLSLIVRRQQRELRQSEKALSVMEVEK